jgi:hypothetical protein
VDTNTARCKFVVDPFWKGGDDLKKYTDDVLAFSDFENQQPFRKTIKEYKK